jgi:hypothetical protein
MKESRDAVKIRKCDNPGGDGILDHRRPRDGANSERRAKESLDFTVGHQRFVRETFSVVKAAASKGRVW